MEYLSVICGGLGRIEEDDDGNQIGYTRGQYCLDNLKDLLRFLRRDDPEAREVFKQICKWNIVGKDILLIIQHCQDDTTLVLNSVKVLVYLTMPIEPTSKDIPQQLEYLWNLKSLITHSHAIAVIVTLLEGPLEHLEGDLFTEDDWKLVQLVITLFRNILAVQEITMQQRAVGSASEFINIRDRFLELLFEENVMDLILVFTQHVGGPHGAFRKDNLLLLETFYYIYKGQVPEQIARAHLDSNIKVEGATATHLKSLMEEEKAKRRQMILSNSGSRLQFSGSFTRVTMDGSKVLVKGNPCSDSHESLLKGYKSSHNSSKKMQWDSGRMPTTNKNLLRLLQDFTNSFLLGGYNVLMQSIRQDIEKEHHAIGNNEVVIFFQVAEFVMSFQNHILLGSKADAKVSKSESCKDYDSDSTLFEGKICGSISETMNESMFLLVISKWRSAFDGLKETNNYTFLSAAGSLTKTMIHMLDLVLKLSAEDSKEPQTARVLLYKLFYDQTDQGMTYFLFNLIKTFNAHKQPKSDLADLVETIHIVIRLMENLQSRGTLRVAKKSRKKRKKKVSVQNKDANDADQKKDINGSDQVTVQTEHLISETENTEPVKEISQETNVNNNKDADIINKECDQLNPTNPDKQETDCNVENNKSGNANDDYVSDDSSDDEPQESTNEVDFKASSLVSSLANNTIIQNLCWLLKFYKSNSLRTNHYIICALKRICEDLELSPMLYQLSLLIIFDTILEEQKSNPSKEHENIVLFLTSLVRRMLRKMKNDPLLFVEILFWKTRKECHYINCESMLKDLGKMRNEYRKSGNDNNNQHEDVGRNRWVRKSIADALGDDEADVVIPPWRDVDQSEENQEQKSLKKSKLDVGEGAENINEEFNNEHPNQHKQVKARKRLKPLVLDDALEEKLKHLFDKYKEFPDCSQRIVAELNLEVSPAQITKKIKELGLKFPSKRRVGNTELQQPSFVRKRVRAFSEDQEMKIKTLFEQFKDEKKCSQKIANALDDEGKFTAAQVSRKLRQLGLFLRKQNSGENMNLRDEEDASDSDDQTLLSLKKRSKKKQNLVPTEDENGDQMSDDFDDIVLSSAFGKKSKRLSQTKTRESQNDSLNHNDGEKEPKEVNEIGSGEKDDVMMSENPNYMQYDELNDDLDDDQVEKNASEGSSPKATNGSRRKLRMIMDLDDEED